MVKINAKIKERTLLRIEEILAKKRAAAAKKIDAWRERNARVLRKWKGIKIIRFFREKR